MTEHSAPPPDDGNEHAEQIRRVVYDCIRRRAEGESVSDDALIASHPDLMPELANRLRKLSVVEAAQRQVDSHGGDAEDVLHVRCPHCHEPMEVRHPAELTGLRCALCGSDFSLVDPSQPPTVEKLENVGRFRLLDKLGVGAFGVVWSALDTELDRTVAVKIPRKSGMDATETEKFIREARAAAQITHPNIVQVHEVGRDGDRVYLVTDFVEGQNLADWLTDQRPTPREAAELCAIIADALNYAHQRGVIHRDLKPSNVMVDALGQPHLMDFGLAKREADEVTMTLDGKLLGTPAYMSPEQARGAAHEADCRTDVYSLGVILYELLVGERPFRGDTRMMIHQVLVEDPRGPRKLNARIPKDLETICLRCLEKAPNRRYQTAAKLSDDLRRFLRGEPVQARPVTGAARAWRLCKRNPLPSSLAALLLIGLTVGLAAITWLWKAVTYEVDRHRRQAYLSGIVAAQQAWNSNDVELCTERLNQHLPRGGQSDLRDFEWHLLKRLCRRSESAEMLQENGGLGRLDITRDGRFLANTDLTMLKLWDIENKVELLSLEAHDALAPGIAISPDEQLIATGARDGLVKLWRIDWNTPSAVFFKELPIECWSGRPAFSPDGRRLATSGPNGRILLWDWAAQTAKPYKTLDGDAGRINNLAFSSLGVLASATDDGVVCLWDIAETTPLHKLPGHSATCNGIAFSPDGATFAAGAADDSIVLYDVVTGVQKHVLRGHSQLVLAASFSADGEVLASGSNDGTIRLWDTQAGNGLDEIRGHKDAVWDVLFHPQRADLLVSYGDDGTIRLWDLSTPKAQDIFEGDRMAFSEDGESFTIWKQTGSEAQLRLFDTASGEVTSEFSLDDATVVNVALLPEDLHAVIRTTDGVVEQLDLTTNISRRLMKTGVPVDAAEVSSDGRTLALIHYDPDRQSHLGTLGLFDLKTCNRRTSLHINTNAFAFSWNGQWVAATSQAEHQMNHSISIHTLDGAGVATLDGHLSPVYALAFSRDDMKLASGSYRGEIKVWNIESGDLLLGPLKGHTDTVHSVAFSPSHTRLASGSADGIVKLWSASTGEEIMTLEVDGSSVVSVAFSRDASTLAAATAAGTVKLWRAK